MTATRRPRQTEKAIQARVRATDNRHATRLRSHGWFVLSPEEATAVLADSGGWVRIKTTVTRQYAADDGS